mgnify:CR=1 FL=1
MIGVRKRIIAFLDESGRAPTYTVMLNPEIIKKDGAYDTEEGCLSLLGGPRPCKRYKNIKLPLSSQRGRRVDVDPNKYYIKFTVNREGESILMGLAHGDEQMYTWDIPRTENYTCKPTRFVSLTTSKIKIDLSHNGMDVLYELPNELVWLYEKIYFGAVVFRGRGNI